MPIRHQPLTFKERVTIQRHKLRQATIDELKRRENAKPLIAFKQNGVFYYWNVIVTTDEEAVKELITKRGGKIYNDLKIDVPRT